MNRQPGVIIAGGGLSGLSAAVECAKRGLAVTLLEAETIGNGASGKNAGHLCHGFIPTDQEMIALLGAGHTETLWHMSHEGVAIVRERAACYETKFAIDCGLRMGYLTVARAPGQFPKIRRHYRQLFDRYGYTGTTESGPAAIARELNLPNTHGGIYDPGMGQIEPTLYLQGLRCEAEALHVTIIENAKVETITPGIPARLSYCHNGQRDDTEASAIILAGYQPASLIPAARRKIIVLETHVGKTAPLSPEQAANLFPHAWTVADYSNLLTYFRRTADSAIIFGSGDGPVNASTAKAQSRLQAMFNRIFPQLGAIPFAENWSGRLDFTANRLPHLSRHQDNIFTLQGFSGLGLAMTAIAGRVTAEAITGAPERFTAFATIPHRNLPQHSLLQAIGTRLKLWHYSTLDYLEARHGSA